jgi:hypothetical protein
MDDGKIVLNPIRRLPSAKEQGKLGPFHIRSIYPSMDEGRLVSGRLRCILPVMDDAGAEVASQLGGPQPPLWRRQRGEARRMEEVVPSGVEVVPRLIFFTGFLNVARFGRCVGFFFHVGGRLGEGRTKDTTSSHLI